MSALRQLYEVEALELLTEDEATAKRLGLHAEEAKYPIKRKAARAKGREVAADVSKVLERADCEAEELLNLHGTADAVGHVAEWVKWRALRNLCDWMSVDYPDSKYGKACEVARLSSGDWWGRKLRVADWRTYEMRKIRLGEIDRYTSLEIATAHQWHKAAIEQILDNLYAVRSDGAALMTLLEAANKSKSNPAIRRAAMIRQAKGMAELATERGWSWAFFTLTCPSRFHRMTTVEVDGQKARVLNEKWDGSSPRDAQQYLRKVWQRVRAKLQRLGIDCMFCRVAEPHLDACPHWHGIFWAKEADLPRIHETLRHYGLEVDGNEAGAQLRRVKWEPYKPKKAHRDAGVTDEQHSVNCAIGYLIAYIGKNIDGKREDETAIGETKDRDGNKVDGDTIENAVRAVAWASLWGIHQFHFGGGECIGPYEELRRLKAGEIDDDELEAVRQAADAGDVAEYMRLSEQMGLELWQETSRDRIEAIATERGLPLAASEELVDAAIEAGLFNRWGEPAKRWVLGVKVADNDYQAVKTRRHEWLIGTGDKIAELAGSLVEGGHRLLELLKEKVEQQRQKVEAEYTRFASALAVRFQGDREAAPLGPGSITVRGSDGPPDGDDGGEWYAVDAFGIERGNF